MPAPQPKTVKRRRLDISFLVSAHQPYVLGYEAWPHGARWLCAAVADQYIPLLNLLSRLVSDGIQPSIGVCLGPLLCEMLADLEFAPLFQAYMQERIDAAAENQADFASQGLYEQRDLAIFWQSRDTNIARDFEQAYAGDLVGAFRQLQENGHIELLAAPVTAAKLGHLSDIRAVRGQIAPGIDSYKKHFARAPRGMVLHADAFSGARGDTQKIADDLAAELLDYTVILGGAAPAALPLQSTEPIAPASWARLGKTTLIGCTAEPRTMSCAGAEAASFLDPVFRHYPGGHPFWRRGLPETDPSGKQLYDPVKVPGSCEALAKQFVARLSESPSAVMVALEFPGPTARGNWYEWNRWFYRVLKKTVSHKTLRLQSGEKLAAAIAPEDRKSLPIFAPPGRARRIRAAAEDWTWHGIVECQQIQARLAGMHGATRNPKLRQILAQCERELLLLQARDWQTLLQDPATNDYAAMRFARHKDDFGRLAALADKIAAGRFLSEGERTYVARLEQRDRCFAEISLRHWNS